MSPHYHCTYQHVPNEVRLRFRRVVGCPWPYMLMERCWCNDLKCERETVRIGLN